LPSSLEVAVDIAGIAGLFVSTAGLWFSFKAWRRAMAAEQAAKDAREAVRRGNAAEELEALAALAKELLACVQGEQIEAAVLRGRDLVAGINQARVRWNIPVESGLEEIERDVESISTALTIRKGQMMPIERENLLNFCHKALRMLSREAGRMASLVDSFSGR
jgi:hypothetical protein